MYSRYMYYTDKYNSYLFRIFIGTIGMIDSSLQQLLPPGYKSVYVKTYEAYRVRQVFNALSTHMKRTVTRLYRYERK